MSEPALFTDATAVRSTATQSVQWRAQTLQMVNWGGFHGHKAIDLSPSSTLLTGASGTGKSTVLDAYLALMMRSDTPFNAASNDAVVGKARTQDQRTLVTYLRGKMDINVEAGTGQLKDLVLRPGVTWGAVAMTFVDDNRRQFTALRAYYVPATATAFRDVTMKLATFDGYLDLRKLGEIAAAKFDNRALKAAFPNIKPAEGPVKFAETLYTRLGIGANGNGAMALRLLARVQGGQQVKTVDGLYKQMVLEKPSTYEKADKAIKHFEALEQSYEEMKTEAAKEEVLARIPNLHDDIVEAQETIDRIDTYRHDRDGATPFRLWRLHTEFTLLDAAEGKYRTEREHQSDLFKSAEQLEADLKKELATNLAEQRNNGADTLERLEQDISGLEKVKAEAETEVIRYETNTSSVLDLAPTDKDTFNELKERARAFLDTYDTREQEIADERDSIRDHQRPLVETRTELTAELELLQKREGLVPPRLDNLRTAVAEAAGLNIEDLPFVAELIDVKPGEERWRKAAEVTLYGPVRVMLVNEDHLEHLSASIDSLHLPYRLNFEGVRLQPHTDASYDPARISGKLIFKDSPFSLWVQARVRDTNIDALCVASPRDLRGPGPRVTVNGQTRHGKRGAHGDVGDRPIIGFSNQTRKQDIAKELEDLTAKFDALTKRTEEVAERATMLRKKREAFTYVDRTRWADIDVPGITARLEDRQTERDCILDDNEPLKALKEAEGRLNTQIEEASGRKHTAKNRRDELNAKYLKVVDDKDDLGRTIESIEDTQTVVLTETQSKYLDDVFAEVVTDPTDHERFTANVTLLTRRLSERTRSARTALNNATETLIGIFREYQNRWRDPSLGEGLAAYDNYLRVLDTIRATGLHEKQDDWSRQMARWSSEDLVPLNGAFGAAITEIENRLRPVNDILTTLPFGAKNHRLYIKMRALTSDDMVKLRRELQHLASGTAKLDTRNDLEAQFQRLRMFMRKIQEPTGDRSSTTRDYYLDVRKHVEITAAALDGDGVERATYTSLGGKSGGESQELVAFIVGAALRFQLGDEDRDRPRFAPVFLDEGFVKSDSEFAGRSVAAWKRLGFQLIVGVPLDKVNALEPDMDQTLLITKSDQGYSHVSAIKDKAKLSGGTVR